MMRTSQGSDRSAYAGRALWVKVNLPIFKDIKMKDAVTYCSWWGDMAMFLSVRFGSSTFAAIHFPLIARISRQLGLELGKHATLNDMLQMLDKHYGVIMAFNTLSKELYSLKQGLGEEIAEFGVCLSQQVQILQLEYTGKIWPEHMVEMKHDCFYEGLNPEYCHMLAYKVDGENPDDYSDLLLATQKLERRAETRNPLPPKTAVTSGLNMICSQTLGNLFPLHKLKSHHTFTV